MQSTVRLASASAAERKKKKKNNGIFTIAWRAMGHFSDAFAALHRHEIWYSDSRKMQQKPQHFPFKHSLLLGICLRVEPAVGRAPIKRNACSSANRLILSVCTFECINTVMHLVIEGSWIDNYSALSASVAQCLVYAHMNTLLCIYFKCSSLALNAIRLERCERGSDENERWLPLLVHQYHCRNWYEGARCECE